jgi:hypothetical protein
MIGYLNIIPVEKQINIVTKGEYHEQLALTRLIERMVRKYGWDYVPPNKQSEKVIKDFEKASIAIITKQLENEMDILLLMDKIEDVEINRQMIEFLNSLKT